MDVSNFHFYLQHPIPKKRAKGKEAASDGGTQTKRRPPNLSAAMTERLCELFKFSEQGFTEPMLDSWLVRGQQDWDRLNECFDIRPLLIIDSTESISRFNLIQSKETFGLQLYEPNESAPGIKPDADLEAEAQTGSNSYMYQFALVKVVVGETWRAILIRATGFKLQSFMPEFWANQFSDRTVFQYQKRHQLFHIQQALAEPPVEAQSGGSPEMNSEGPPLPIDLKQRRKKHGEVSEDYFYIHLPPSAKNTWHAPNASNLDLDRFIKERCYPIIQERLEKRFDVERVEKGDKGVPKNILLGRPERLRRYAQIIRSMFSLTVDPLNHLGGTTKDHSGHPAEVEVACVFEEDSDLIMRGAVARQPGDAVVEYLIVLREYKNGLVELVYNGPREELSPVRRNAYFNTNNLPSGLITERVRAATQNRNIDWYTISLTDLRIAYKQLHTDASLLSA